MSWSSAKEHSNDKYMKTYNVFKLGDIAFEGHKSKKFSFGRFVLNTIGDGIVSHIFEVFSPISDSDETYWKYAIHYEPLMRKILVKSTTQATMMNSLVTKDFLRQSIHVPEKLEQFQIGKLLSTLDSNIAANEDKYELAQNGVINYRRKFHLF